MIQHFPKYKAIFDARNIDPDCGKIVSLMRNGAYLITEALDAGLHKPAVTMYLQLFHSMCNALQMMSIIAISMTFIVLGM